MNNDQHKQDPPKEPKQLEPKAREEVKREPQHEPGFAAKQQAETDKDHGKADKVVDHTKPRSHAARAKQHVKRAKIRKHK